MSGNKDRSTNFCKEETQKLMTLLKDYPVITSKKTDNTSNKQKDAAWVLLADKFNQDATIYRSVKQLQQKFNNMKKIARKEMATEKYGRRQTGGGPAPPKPSETSEWLNTLMKESISGLAAVYDSDVLIDITNSSIHNNATQDPCTSANINLEFLEDDIYPECSSSQLKMKENKTIIEVDNEIATENIPRNEVTCVDANVFDTSTPKSMLRNPVSKELVYTKNKRKSSYTPLETRKQIIMHTNKKNEFLAQKQARELDLAKYAKEEHEQNMRFKKEAHEKAMQFKEELHKIELNFREEMNKLVLEKCKYELEKAKLEKNKISKDN